MKFYHGSPNKVEILEPAEAKGINDFQNKKAVFLTKDLDVAALYALGKSLKGKTQFAIKDKLIIVGNLEPAEKGYVYEIELYESDVETGEIEGYDFAYGKSIKHFNLIEVDLENYKDKIVRVENKEKLMEALEK